MKNNCYENKRSKLDHHLIEIPLSEINARNSRIKPFNRSVYLKSVQKIVL